MKHREGEQLLFARASPPPLGIFSEFPGPSMPQLQALWAPRPVTHHRDSLPKNPKMACASDGGHPRRQRAHGTRVTHPKWESAGGSPQGERCHANHAKAAASFFGVAPTMTFKTSSIVPTTNQRKQLHVTRGQREAGSPATRAVPVLRSPAPRVEPHAAMYNCMHSQDSRNLGKTKAASAAVSAPETGRPSQRRWHPGPRDIASCRL